MASKIRVTIIIFVGIFLFSITMLLVENFPSEKIQITGHATTRSTVSNVTIESYFSISMSENLAEGILFGSVDSLPADNINASHNYDGGSDATTMFLNVSTDSNTAVDFCIKANANLTSAGLDTIGIGNETYSNSTTTNSTIPELANQVSLTTGHVKSGVNITRGSTNYYRVWLDIPAAQAPGTYNNTVEFKGVNTGVAC